MAKHTPGPWRINFAEDWSYRNIYPGDNCEMWAIARALNVLGEENRDANARLIAAAPDLLAAAERLAAVNSDPMTFEASDYDAAWDAMHAAIAKAKGG